MSSKKIAAELEQISSELKSKTSVHGWPNDPSIRQMFKWQKEMQDEMETWTSICIEEMEEGLSEDGLAGAEKALMDFRGHMNERMEDLEKDLLSVLRRQFR